MRGQEEEGEKKNLERETGKMPFRIVLRHKTKHETATAHFCLLIPLRQQLHACTSGVSLETIRFLFIYLFLFL